MIVHLNNTNAGYYNYDESKSPINKDFLRTEVNLDILHGCNQMCPGCFIPRKNLTGLDNLTQLYNLLKDGSYYPDEIIVGPTDIFDSQNFYDIIKHPSMKSLYEISAIGYLTTINQPIEMVKEKHKMLWDLYNNIDRIPDIDFKIVLDIDKYLDNELDEWYKKLELFKKGSVQFRVNYSKDVFKRISYNDLCQKVYDDFNAPIVITPSFLTDTNSRGKVNEYLKSFREELINQKIDKKWLNLYTFFHVNFNGFGCQNYSFYNGKLYVNPFLYDAIIQRDDFFISNIDDNLLDKNLNYANKVECSNCEYIMYCAERNVHMYMESRNLETCVALKEYMYADN